MYITEDLIEQIKENTSTEFAQGRFSQSTVIDLCNQETVKRIKPIISNLAAEFFVVTQNIVLDDGTQRIRIPKRAASRGIRDCYFLLNEVRYPLSQMTREESVLVETNDPNIPKRFYFEADSIVFECPTNQEMTLVLVLEISPGKLVLSTEVTTITSVDFDTGIVTFAGTPSGYGTAVPYDFVQQLGYGNAVLGVGITPVSVSGTTYTFEPTELPQTLEAGDYVCLAGNTPIPNMPDEAVTALIHAVSLRIFRLRGDFNAVAAERDELTNAIIYVERALTDRSEGNRTTVKPTNSLLRRRFAWRYR